MFFAFSFNIVLEVIGTILIDVGAPYSEKNSEYFSGGSRWVLNRIFVCLDT